MFWGKKKTEDEERTPQAPPPPSARIRSEMSGALRPASVPPVSARKPTPAPLSAGAMAAETNIGRDELPLFLIEQGHVTEEQLRTALRIQQETGVFFGEVLAEKGILDEQSLVSFLAKYCKIPHLSLLDYIIDKTVLSLIPQEICWKYHLLPVDKLGRNLTVAMVNPLNREALTTITALCPDLRIKPILCANNHFEKVAEKFFGVPDSKDETTWAQLPVSIDTAADEQKEEIRSEESASAAEDAVSHASINSDSLMDSVFGVRIPDTDARSPKAKVQTELKTEADVASTDMHSMLQQFTGVMMDSMRDTYDLLARKIPFFNGVLPEDVAKIFSQGKVEEFEAGYTLFRKGDSGSMMYVILNGRIEIRDGHKRIATLEKGEILGEMTLVGNEVRSADAVTIARSCLLTLSYDDIRGNMTPPVAIQLLANIIATLSQRLRIANDAGI